MKKRKVFLKYLIAVFLLSNVSFINSEIMQIKNILNFHTDNIKELNLNRKNFDSDTGIKEVQMLKGADQAEAFYYFNMAKAYQQDKLFDKAIENYNLAINANPELEGAYNMLGLIYAEKGDYKNSVEVFKKYLNFSDSSEEEEVIKQFINKLKEQNIKSPVLIK